MRLLSYALLLSLIYSSADARDFDYNNQDRIKKIERELGLINKRINKLGNVMNKRVAILEQQPRSANGTPLPPSSNNAVMADLEARIEVINEENRRLKGDNERLSHENSSLRQEVNRTKADAEIRFQDIEERLLSIQMELDPDAAGANFTEDTDTSTGTATSAAPVIPQTPAPTPVPATQPALSTPLKFEQPTNNFDDITPENLNNISNQFFEKSEVDLPLTIETNTYSDSKAAFKPYQVASVGSNEAQFAKIDDSRQSTDGVSVPVSDTKSLRARQSQSELQDAFSDLSSKRYESARKKFHRVISNYPDLNNISSEAYFWLGEGYAEQGDLENAALQYLRGYRDYPNAVKGPESLLKMAVALHRMNKNDEACKSLNKFDDGILAGLAVRQRVESMKVKIGC